MAAVEPQLLTAAPSSVPVEWPSSFDGNEPLQWIDKVERFFCRFGTIDPYRLKIAAILFDGPVVPWFQELQQSGHVTSWALLKNAILAAAQEETFQLKTQKDVVIDARKESDMIVEMALESEDAPQVFAERPQGIVDVAPIYTAGIKTVDDAFGVFDEIPKREVPVDLTSNYDPVDPLMLSSSKLLQDAEVAEFATVRHQLEVLEDKLEEMVQQVDVVPTYTEEADIINHTQEVLHQNHVLDAVEGKQVETTLEEKTNEHFKDILPDNPSIVLLTRVEHTPDSNRPRSMKFSVRSLPDSQQSTVAANNDLHMEDVKEIDAHENVCQGGLNFDVDADQKSAYEISDKVDNIRHGASEDKVRELEHRVEMLERESTSGKNEKFSHLPVNVVPVYTAGELIVLKEPIMIANINAEKYRNLASNYEIDRCTYQFLHAYAFLPLFKNIGVNVQFGSSDQWGNIPAGTTLNQKLLQEGMEKSGYVPNSVLRRCAEEVTLLVHGEAGLAMASKACLQIVVHAGGFSTIVVVGLVVNHVAMVNVLVGSIIEAHWCRKMGSVSCVVRDIVDVLLAWEMDAQFFDLPFSSGTVYDRGGLTDFKGGFNELLIDGSSSGFNSWTNPLPDGVDSSPYQDLFAIDHIEGVGGLFRRECAFQSEGLEPKSMGTTLKIVVIIRYKSDDYNPHELWQQQLAWNSMLAAYVQCSHVSQELHSFSSIPEKAVVSGDSQQLMNEEAFQLFQRLQAADFWPELLCFVLTLHECVQFVFFLLWNGCSVVTFAETAYDGRKAQGGGRSVVCPGCVVLSVYISVSSVSCEIAKHYIAARIVIDAHCATISSLPGLGMRSIALTVNVSMAWIPQCPLQILNLHNCRLVRQFHSWIGPQRYLIALNIGTTGISDELPTELGSFSPLQKLIAPNNSFSGHMIALCAVKYVVESGRTVIGNLNEDGPLQFRDCKITEHSCGEQSISAERSPIDTAHLNVSSGEELGLSVHSESYNLSTKTSTHIFFAFCCCCIFSSSFKGFDRSEIETHSPESSAVLVASFDGQNLHVARADGFSKLIPVISGVLVGTGWPWFVPWKLPPPPNLTPLHSQFTVQDLEGKVLIRGEGNVTNYQDGCKLIPRQSMEAEDRMDMSQSQGKRGLLKRT